jgi:DUF4097 and DUF4098 domain-containing protein YvlB
MKNAAAPAMFMVLALPACTGALDYGGDRVHAHVHRTLPANGVRSVRVENIAGPVTITASDANLITIDATENANEADAIARTHVDITREGDELTVHTRYDEEGGSWFSRHNGASVGYDLRLPANLHIDVANVSGSVTAGGMRGDVRIEEVSGPVRASLGPVTGPRRIHINSVSGSIEVTVAKDSDVRVEAKTVSGAIQAFFPGDMHKGFVGESLDGRVGAGTASMVLAAVSGGITITSQQ